MQVILIALGIYLLYRFIFGFLIPVINTTSQVKKQFSAMKEKMDDTYKPSQGSSGQNRRQEAPPTHAEPLGKTTSGKPGAKEDYIEYEDL